MITNASDFISVILWASFIMLIYVLLYRKHIFSVYDPLVFFLLTNTFTTLVMFMKVDATKHLLYFTFCQIGLWFGITFFKYNINRKEVIQFNPFNIKLLKAVIYVSFLIYLLANIYAASRVGFPLLTEDPTGAKSAVYVGGLGIVRRINWGLSIYISCGSFIMLFISQKKRVYVFILLIQLLFTVLGGSKGGILIFLFMLAYIIKRPGFQGRLDFKVYRKYNKYLKYIFVIGLIVAITVLYREKGTVVNALSGLFNRLLLSGDVILYYYQPFIISHFQKLYSPLDFFSHEFNSFLGLLRITEYRFPFGYEMLKLHLQHTGEEIPTIVIGPNTQFFIRGHIFFGFIGGAFYSLIVGLVIGFLRKSFFISKPFSLIRFSFYYSFVMIAFSYAVDSNIFVSQLIDMLLFVLPVFFLCYSYLKLQNQLSFFATDALN